MSFPSSLTAAPWGTELTVIEMAFGGASGCNSAGRERATTSIDVGIPEAPTVVWNLTDCPTPTLLKVIQPSRLILIEQVKEKRSVRDLLVPAIFRTGVDDVVMQIAHRAEFLELAETEAQDRRARGGPGNDLPRRFPSTDG